MRLLKNFLEHLYQLFFFAKESWAREKSLGTLEMFLSLVFDKDDRNLHPEINYQNKAA